MKNKIILSVSIFVFSGLIFGSFSKEESSDLLFTVYKSMNCGCCTSYIAELKRDYNVDVVISSDSELSEIKDSLNIDPNMRSCHTILVGDYFIEGHVPIEAVEKLLAENPNIDGISLPRMPAGSPGMGGVKSGLFTIYSITDGNIDTFMVI